MQFSVIFKTSPFREGSTLQEGIQHILSPTNKAARIRVKIHKSNIHESGKDNPKNLQTHLRDIKHEREKVCDPSKQESTLKKKNRHPWKVGEHGVCVFDGSYLMWVKLAPQSYSCVKLLRDWCPKVIPSDIF